MQYFSSDQRKHQFSYSPSSLTFGTNAAPVHCGLCTYATETFTFLQQRRSSLTEGELFPTEEGLSSPPSEGQYLQIWMNVFHCLHSVNYPVYPYLPHHVCMASINIVVNSSPLQAEMVHLIPEFFTPIGSRSPCFLN